MALHHEICIHHFPSQANNIGLAEVKSSEDSDVVFYGRKGSEFAIGKGRENFPEEAPNGQIVYEVNFEFSSTIQEQ